jgi:hypothetical protein
MSDVIGSDRCNISRLRLIWRRMVSDESSRRKKGATAPKDSGASWSLGGCPVSRRAAGFSAAASASLSS